MNPADVRALIAIVMAQVDMLIANIVKEPDYKPSTMDTYLGIAQQVLESSWQNYKHPAGMDNSQLGVDEAIALLTSKGYGVTVPVPVDASTPQPPSTAGLQPPST